MGPYELLETVGRGGMGTVFRGRHVQTGKVVAVKVMTAEAASDPTHLRRFEQEFWAATRLQHPHIVRGLDFGLEDGRPYLVMEFVDGPEPESCTSKNRARWPWPRRSSSPWRSPVPWNWPIKTN